MPDPSEQTTGHREHGGWNRCRSCKTDGPCPCSGEQCCDRLLLCGHCPEAPGHTDECCILSEYPGLLAEVERLREQLAAVRAVYDLQAPLQARSGYVDKGAYWAHRWWLTVLGSVLPEVRA